MYVSIRLNVSVSRIRRVSSHINSLWNILSCINMFSAEVRSFSANTLFFRQIAYYRSKYCSCTVKQYL